MVKGRREGNARVLRVQAQLGVRLRLGARARAKRARPAAGLLMYRIGLCRSWGELKMVGYSARRVAQQRSGAAALFMNVVCSVVRKPCVIWRRGSEVLVR